MEKVHYINGNWHIPYETNTEKTETNNLDSKICWLSVKIPE